LAVRARRQDTVLISKIGFAIIRASFQIFIPSPRFDYADTPLSAKGEGWGEGKQKTLHPQQGRRVLSAVPPELRSTCERHFIAITGLPVDDYFISPSKSLD